VNVSEYRGSHTSDARLVASAKRGDAEAFALLYRRYLDRVYTPAEQESYRTGGAASLAARFAAKEAVLKLIGSADGVDPRSVEIIQREGRPEVRLSGLAAALAEEAHLGPIDVSLSHSGDHALAVAVTITQPDLEPRDPQP